MLSEDVPMLTYYWMIVIVAVFALVSFTIIALGLWFLLRRRPAASEPPSVDLRFDVSKLDEDGPPSDGTRMEVYGTPVRLAVLVIAPVGRDGEIPAKEELPDMLEQIVPGLLRVFSDHHPVLRFWPSQLSSQGFTHAFFNKLALPGDRGKGTPWCSVAGKFTAFGGQYLAGLVCCTDSADGLGQFVIEREGQWNDVLRVRS